MIAITKAYKIKQFISFTNQFAMGHKYNCDHSDQTSVAKIRKNAQHTTKTLFRTTGSLYFTI